MWLAKEIAPLTENDMTDEKKTSERLGTPDTGAHDKMHGDKLRSGGVPARPGTGGSEGKPDDKGSENRTGAGA